MSGSYMIAARDLTLKLMAMSVLGCLALAQTATSPQSGRLISVGAGFSGTAYAQSTIAGAPYSAQEVTEHAQTLADGTHINSKPRTTLLYRDSQGRTRTERSTGPVDANVRVVEIHDPVGGFRYVLDPEKKLVHRTALTQFARGAPSTATSGTFIATAPPPLSPSLPTTPGTRLLV